MPTGADRSRREPVRRPVDGVLIAAGVCGIATSVLTFADRPGAVLIWLRLLLTGTALVLFTAFFVRRWRRR